jgi:hypothetical protein
MIWEPYPGVGTTLPRRKASAVPYLPPQMREHLQMFASFWLARQDYTLGQVGSALWTAIDMGFHDKQIDWRNDVNRKTKHR